MSTIVIGTNPTVEDCEADTIANALFTSLTADIADPPTIDLTDTDFTFDPDDSSLYDDPVEISINDLTIGTLSGTGVFDKMMAAVNVQLKKQFNDNRITGDAYARAYENSVIAVLANATQFTLGKDTARWQAARAQMEARTAEIGATVALIELQKAKVDTAKAIYDMQTSGAQYGLTKLEAANAEQRYCLIEAQVAEKVYQNQFLLPASLAEAQHKITSLLPLQTELAQEQIQAARGQTLDTRRDGITPITGLIGRQKESLDLDNEIKQFNIDSTLPAQLAILNEQRESERAKTLDTRSDNVTTIVGSIGKQKDLYDQQIDSFVKDGQYKVAKMYLDSWITQKTLDEGLTAPTQLTNTNIDDVIEGVRLNNNL
jgi:hypothetical protein